MSGIGNYPDPVIGVHRAYLCSTQKKGVIWSNTEGSCIHDTGLVDLPLTVWGALAPFDGMRWKQG